MCLCWGLLSVWSRKKIESLSVVVVGVEDGLSVEDLSTPFQADGTEILSVSSRMSVDCWAVSRLYTNGRFHASHWRVSIQPSKRISGKEVHLPSFTRSTTFAHHMTEMSSLPPLPNTANSPSPTIHASFPTRPLCPLPSTSPLTGFSFVRIVSPILAYRLIRNDMFNILLLPTTMRRATCLSVHDLPFPLGAVTE